MSIADIYEDYFSPTQWIKHFADMHHFRCWVEKASISQLDSLIRDYAAYELYEYCAVMYEIKEKKINKQLCNSKRNA